MKRLVSKETVVLGTELTNFTIYHVNEANL